MSSIGWVDSRAPFVNENYVEFQRSFMLLIKTHKNIYNKAWKYCTQIIKVNNKINFFLTLFSPFFLQNKFKLVKRIICKKWDIWKKLKSCLELKINQNVYKLTFWADIERAIAARLTYLKNVNLKNFTREL